MSRLYSDSESGAYAPLESKEGADYESHESPRPRRWTFSVWSFLALTIVAALAAIGLVQTVKSLISFYSDQSQSFLPSELFERKTVRIFEADPDWDGPPNARNEPLWDQLHRADSGYLYIPNHEAERLQLGKPYKPAYTSETSVYGISAYHALHCLALVRNAFYEPPQSSNKTEEDAALGHVGHCWEYLRQSITCSADLTIETASKSANRIDGYEVTHKTCRNWDAIDAFMRDHREQYLAHGGAKLPAPHVHGHHHNAES